MTAFVDAHAHISSGQFENDREDVVRRALDAGVTAIVNPATTLEDSRAAVELAERIPCVYACVGIHPHDARTSSDAALREIEELSRHPKVVAIGETGLDYHYDLSPRDIQESVFRAHVEMAIRRNLPVVVHTRESIPECLAIVEEAVRRNPGWCAGSGEGGIQTLRSRGLFHCFMGDAATAWRLFGLGFQISLGGAVTFKNATQASKLARKAPLEHFLLETDSPYMAPVPYRGKRNEPARLVHVASRIADLRELTVEDVARATTTNAHVLFGIGDAPPPVFTYVIRRSLYVNLTIRCNADCVFCDRKKAAMVAGHNLRIEREPSVDDVTGEIGDPRRYEEIVFCGYGEPTIRLEALKAIAEWVKGRGGRTRLNTDGHGNVINKRNIVPELAGLLDGVSISLNSADPLQYGSLMNLNPDVYFPAMIAFAREAVKVLPRVVMTIVDLPEIDKEAARRLVEEDIGADFLVRPLF